jgi:D-amino-acid dehydrogenase
VWLCLWDQEARRGFINALVRFSLDKLAETVEREPQIEFNFRQRGSMAVFFDEDEFTKARANLVPERDEVLSRAEALTLEPALARLRFAGAIRHSRDRVGDCRGYALGLSEACVRMGVTFLFGHTVESLETSGGRVVAVRASAPPAPRLLENDLLAPATAVEMPCSFVVVCCGADSAGPLRSAGWDWLPLMPVRGYSLTGTVNKSNASSVPREYILLERPLHVLTTRFGDKLRFASHAEITQAIEPTQQRLQDLQEVVDSLFPGAFDPSEEPVAWVGRRPVTSDSLPITGLGHLPNLLLNCGHGSNGWRLSHGTACLVAQMLAGEPVPVSLHYLSLRRFLWL